jgi:hypothetical protein
VPRRPRILASVRHPGPVHCLAAAMAAVPEAEWHVAAHAGAATLLAESYADVVAGTTLIALPFDEAENPSPAAVRAGLGHCAQLVDDVRPDVVVRTTPSTGWWADEFMATAVAGRAPVIAVQDFPGLGTALRADARRAVERGVDTGLAPDDASARWLAARAGTPAIPVGWLAHDRFHRMRPYDGQRAESRAAAGLAASDICVLVIGSGPDVPLPAEKQLLAQAAGITAAVQSCQVRIAYRGHPRRPEGDAAALYGALHHRLPGTARLGSGRLPPGLAGAAAADVLVSRASVMNLELMAYAATWDSPNPPMSVYLLPAGNFSVAGYWGPGAPGTHRPGGGSLIVSDTTGDAVAHELAAGRPLTGAALARAYVSDPDRTAAVLRPLLLGAPNAG